MNYIIRKTKLKFQKVTEEVIERVPNVSPDIFTTRIGCIEKTFTKQPNGSYHVKEKLNLEPIEID